MAFQQVFLLTIGTVFALAGALMFFYFRKAGAGSERNLIRLEKVEVEVSAPSLIVFVLGVALILTGALTGMDGDGAAPTDPSRETLRSGLAGRIPQTSAAEAAPETYSGTRTISTSDGLLSMTVPASWEDVEETRWVEGGIDVGPALVAAPSRADFYGTWEEPGVAFAASADLAAYFTPEELLDAWPMDEVFLYADSCAYDGRDAYDDGMYRGAYDMWSDCDGLDNLIVTLAAAPDDGSYVVFLFVQVASEADVEALAAVLESFIVQY